MDINDRTQAGMFIMKEAISVVHRHFSSGHDFNISNEPTIKKIRPE